MLVWFFCFTSIFFTIPIAKFRFRLSSAEAVPSLIFETRAAAVSTSAGTISSKTRWLGREICSIWEFMHESLVRASVNY